MNPWTGQTRQNPTKPCHNNIRLSQKPFTPESFPGFVKQGSPRFADGKQGYQPENETFTSFRTAMIINIHPNSTILDLMSTLRDENIVSVQLLNTLPITGSLSGRIVFLRHRSALLFVSCTHFSPMYFRGCRAYAYIVNTPTWPSSFERRIHGMTVTVTRSLSLFGYQSGISQSAVRSLLNTGPIWMDKWLQQIFTVNSGFIISFSSIETCIIAFDKIVGERSLKYSTIEFSSDVHDHRPRFVNHSEIRLIGNIFEKDDLLLPSRANMKTHRSEMEHIANLLNNTKSLKEQPIVSKDRRGVMKHNILDGDKRSEAIEDLVYHMSEIATVILRGLLANAKTMDKKQFDNTTDSIFTSGIPVVQASCDWLTKTSNHLNSEAVDSLENSQSNFGVANASNPKYSNSMLPMRGTKRKYQGDVAA